MNQGEYNVEKSIAAQRSYCEEKHLPEFAPETGVCWGCHRNIYEKIEKRYGDSGITVEQAGSMLITGCPHCHRTFCD